MNSPCDLCMSAKGNPGGPGRICTKTGDLLPAQGLKACPLDDVWGFGR